MDLAVDLRLELSKRSFVQKPLLSLRHTVSWGIFQDDFQNTSKIKIVLILLPELNDKFLWSSIWSTGIFHRYWKNSKNCAHRWSTNNMLSLKGIDGTLLYKSEKEALSVPCLNLPKSWQKVCFRDRCCRDKRQSCYFSKGFWSNNT